MEAPGPRECGPLFNLKWQEDQMGCVAIVPPVASLLSGTIISEPRG